MRSSVHRVKSASKLVSGFRRKPEALEFGKHRTKRRRSLAVSLVGHQQPDFTLDFYAELY
ncbi:MAG: hypothetical protein LCH99_09120 [Proteobacteria bacterium]|uniref:hypothetical protein n=1 Tax=Shinella sp. JR1-6 TaxID=2527671 RepID=UPI0014052593|nr:hypothetical protein [Shinella sp. JR1-6]MCA0339885.1 hypothetical protein [Pseudomonadota bacterium]